MTRETRSAIDPRSIQAKEVRLSHSSFNQCDASAKRTSDSCTPGLDVARQATSIARAKGEVAPVLWTTQPGSGRHFIALYVESGTRILASGATGNRRHTLGVQVGGCHASGRGFIVNILFALITERKRRSHSWTKCPNRHAKRQDAEHRARAIAVAQSVCELL